MSLLSIEQIEHAYFGRKVLDGVSLRLDRGERLALIGDNGAGKTTLMRLIMGLEKPNAGRIVLAGQAIPAYLSQMQDVSEYAGASSLMNPQLARLEDELRTLEHEIAATAQQPVAQARVLTRCGEKTAAFEAMGGYDFPRRMNEALRGLGLMKTSSCARCIHCPAVKRCGWRWPACCSANLICSCLTSRPTISTWTRWSGSSGS